MYRWKWLFAGLVAILSGVAPLGAQRSDRLSDPGPSARASRAMNPIGLTAVGNRVFFFGTDPWHGSELWRSDGTASGTRFVKDLVPGPASPWWGFMTSAGGLLFFGPEVRSSLWRSDGTAAGTFPLAAFSWIRDEAELNGQLYFTADRELWKSDGTLAGTVRVKHIGGSDTPRYLTRAGDRLFFFAIDNGSQLWTSDGTEAGTLLVKSVSGSDVVAVDSTLFFTGPGPTGGSALWKSDGIEAGTVMVRDIPPGPAGHPGVAMGGLLFFQAWTSAAGLELWRSDGTEAGTYMVRDLHPGPTDSSVESWAVMDGALFFSASDNFGPYELWRSDGTEAGTVRLADVLGVPTGTNPECLTTVESTLYYSASDAEHGTELWQRDGTTAGTMPKDLNPGAAGSNPHYLTVVGQKLFFAANDGDGDRLWRSGAAGTGRVDQWPGGCRFPGLCQTPGSLPSAPPMRVPQAGICVRFN